MFDLLPATSAAGDVIKARVKRVHNLIYANDTIKQQSRVFDEVAKVMLAKLAWERDPGSTPFGPENGDREEIAVKGRSAELYRRIEHWYQAATANDAETDPIHLSPHVLAQAAAEFADIALLGSDAKGTAFQAIVGPQLRAEKGQFFTPEPAKRLLGAILDPRVGEVVLDPACGSGGLLTPFPHATLIGTEIDSALARVARLGVRLHAEAHAEILALDALAPLAELGERLPVWAQPGNVDVVVTNPPFGTKGRVTNPTLLRDLPALGGSRPSQVPEVLFIERIIQWLRPGGRAGIVLPLGLLANPSTSYVREYIRREAEIVATVSLPADTFRPADNGVQAALLFIRKRGGNRPPATTAYMAVVNEIGYDHRERPVMRLGPDGNLVLHEDVSAVIEAWHVANRDHRWF